jgi:hypothetical protein
MAQTTCGGTAMISQEQVLELYDVIAQIYARNGVGGALHIVLDDGNTEDHHIKWCIETMQYYPEEEQKLYTRCAELLMLVKNPRNRYRKIEKAFDKMRQKGA